MLSNLQFAFRSHYARMMEEWPGWAPKNPTVPLSPVAAPNRPRESPTSPVVSTGAPWATWSGILRFFSWGTRSGNDDARSAAAAMAGVFWGTPPPGAAGRGRGMMPIIRTRTEFVRTRRRMRTVVRAGFRGGAVSVRPIQSGWSIGTQVLILPPWCLDMRRTLSGPTFGICIVCESCKLFLDNLVH